jgi:hypothetical protein
VSVIAGQKTVSTMSNCMVVLPELIIDIMGRPHVRFRTHALIRPAYLNMDNAGRREIALSIIISTAQYLLDFIELAHLVI